MNDNAPSFSTNSDFQETPDDLILDATKISWHMDRFNDWRKGKRIAPITIEMALTRSCNYACHFCYAMTQENDRSVIKKEHMDNFLEDCKEIGVKAINYTSDGESSVSPIFVDSITKADDLGLDVATSTNGFTITPKKADQILPALTYIRINFSAGEKKRYAEIMGCKENFFDRVVENIKYMVKLKKEKNLKVTIGLQMVLMPEYADQIIPLAKLGKELQPDYLVIKHCSDNNNEEGREYGDLGVKYNDYKTTYDLLKEAESYSDENYKVIIKWSKIESKGVRSYQRCYGTPFNLQLSGSGLVAPCAQLFNERYKKFHIGNITQERFIDIFNSKRYWEVMNYLSSSYFNAQKMCGNLCVQDKTNQYIDNVVKGFIEPKTPKGKTPEHINFI